MSLAKKTNDTVQNIIAYAIEVVAKASGNVFTEQHNFLIETKVKKRMMDLGIRDPDDYFSYLHEHKNEENEFFISELTTHHTFFFREFRHFEYLLLNMVDIVKNVKSRGEKEIKILCLACSRGQEAYSLAMFFDLHLKQLGFPEMTFKILGTDVDKESVKTATNGVYKYTDIKSIPMKYISNHWQRGKGEIQEYVKIKKEMREKCNFRFGNIEKLNEELSEQFDIIFCRNVFIYFSEQQIKSISSNILKHLRPNGIFFTGVSESLTTLGLPMISNGPSIYGHPKVAEVEKVVKLDLKTIPSRAAVVVEKPKTIQVPDPLKILCVDDSKIILQLLKKIFGAAQGYEVVGTAENGEKAEEFLKNNKVDIMTLDIHMPVMDGLTYLKKNFNASHPPVVIVSSVAREDAFKAMEGMKLGASDYIEKPTLEDFVEKGDEICTKLRAAVLEKLMGTTFTPCTIDKEFASQSLEKPEECFYTIYAHFNDKKKFTHILKEMNHESSNPATYLMFEGAFNILDGIKDELTKSNPAIKFELTDNSKYENKPGVVYICDFKKDFKNIYAFNSNKKSSMIVLGHHSDGAADLIKNQNVSNLLLDDINFVQDSSPSKLQSLAVDTGPYTSFAYQAKHFIIKGN